MRQGLGTPDQKGEWQNVVLGQNSCHECKFQSKHLSSPFPCMWAELLYALTCDTSRYTTVGFPGRRETGTRRLVVVVMCPLVEPATCRFGVGQFQKKSHSILKMATSHNVNTTDWHNHLLQKCILKFLAFATALNYGFGKVIYPIITIVWWGDDTAFKRNQYRHHKYPSFTCVETQTSENQTQSIQD